jgi:hypothetical protein
LRYDFHCQGCGETEEWSIPVGDRDSTKPCGVCGGPSTRVFVPAQIMIPERFGLSMQALTPTYNELAAQDKRNDEYLNQKKEPAKPSFEDCLEKACVANRVDPQKLNEYKLEEMTL